MKVDSVHAVGRCCRHLRHRFACGLGILFQRNTLLVTACAVGQSDRPVLIDLLYHFAASVSNGDGKVEREISLPQALKMITTAFFCSVRTLF